jgi:hypothetical protein
MNIVKKREYIQSYLRQADESTINEFYEQLRLKVLMKQKLENRALNSENDIIAGNVYSRDEVVQKINRTGNT